MSVRQYIGARYVPRFVGTWNNTTQYEALDVVDNGSGTSYIARKIVPAGTPLNNTDFWFVYGASSGAIIDLQNRMGTAENDIIALNNRADGIETEISHIHDTTNMRGHKVVFLGDSYNFHGTGWLTPLVSYMGIQSGDYYDFTVSGHGFNPDGGGKWIDDITSFVNQYASIADQITDIIIVGGINDSGATAIAGLSTAINTFLTYVRSHLPNAYVSVAYVGSARANSSVLSGRTFENRMKALNTYITNLNTDMSRVLNGTQNALCQYTLFESDGLHPNAYGVTAIARAVAQALKSGKYELALMDSVTNTSTVFIRTSNTIDNIPTLHIETIAFSAGEVIPKAGDSTTYTKALPITISHKNFNYVDTVIHCNDGDHPVSVGVVDGDLSIMSTSTRGGLWQPLTIPTGGGYLVNLKLTDYTNNQ